MTNKKLWQAALGEIELNISKANFITWFQSTNVIQNKTGIVTVSTSNAFSKEWLENKYNKLILEALRHISPEIKEVGFVIATTSQKPKLTKASLTKTKKPSLAIAGQGGFQELEINKETNLNPRYDFDNFIIGSFNELAQAAAQGIIKKLGQAYNPLFIYGGVGLGKTHLLQAIGNEVAKKYKNKKLKYISADKFTSELIQALHDRQIEDFKNAYRKIDVLIIDDIQFIAGKEKTQEEFFHTFNALYQKNKQIVLSSDRPPKALSTLEERLRSRFEGGMIADIGYPDLETRIAILKTKAEHKEVHFSDEIFNFIAAHIQKNIRELEGALNRIIAFSKLNNSDVSLSQAKKILASIITKPKKLVNYKQIIKTVADFYDVGIDNLINKCRKKEVVWPRQIIMYLMRDELKCSYPFIGEKLGKRDHTTAIYAYKKLKQEIENNESFQQEMGLIKERLYK